MALNTPSFKKLRSPGELLDNIISSATISPSLIASLPADVRNKANELNKQVEKENELREELNSYIEYIESLEKSQNDYSKQIKDINDKAQKTQKQVSKLSQDNSELGQELSQQLTDNQASVESGIHQAIESAGQDLEQVKQFIKGFSLACGGNGKIRPEVARQAMELFRKKPNVLQIAKMLGYLKKAVVDKRTVKDLGEVGEISEFRRGKFNIGTMAPQELVRMVMPDSSPIKIDFNKRALSNQIQNIKRESERPSPKGKGTLVIMRDKSSSMYGNNDQLAKGVEWALLEIAQKEKRDFYSIPFAGYNQYYIWQAPKKVDPKSVIEHFSHSCGGGTEPYAPLVEALKLIKNNELKADILIITDGNFGAPPSGLMEKIAEMKQEFPLKIFTVLLGTENEIAEIFSDKVVKVSDLWNDKKQIAEIIADI